MARNFYIVTPCGGSIAEAQTTAESVSDIARVHHSISFVHYLVFNNGLTSAGLVTEPAPTNYEMQLIDLGALASRAKARNAGLDRIGSLGDAGLVCFLDSGDVLLNEGAIEFAFDAMSSDPKGSLWAFAARIVGADVRSTRRPRPLRLKKINNPFLIGATFVTTDLAIRARFGEGSKEDWKYWLELLSTDPTVDLRSEVAYEYRVVSTTDHLLRKRRLLRDQYRFFSDYLGYGHGIRTVGSMVAHTVIAATAWLRRSNRFWPSRRWST